MQPTNKKIDYSTTTDPNHLAVMKNAIDYAKQNPDSPQAKKVSQMINSGKYDTQLQAIGFDKQKAKQEAIQRKQQTPQSGMGYLANQLNPIEQAKKMGSAGLEAIQSAGKQAGERIGQFGEGFGKVEQGIGDLGNLLQGKPSEHDNLTLAGGLSEMGGSIAGYAGDIMGDMIKAGVKSTPVLGDMVKTYGKPLVEKIANSQTVHDLAKTLNDHVPEGTPQRDVLNMVANFASILPGTQAEKGLAMAGKVAETGAEALGKAGELAGGAVKSTGQAIGKGVSGLSKGIDAGGTLEKFGVGSKTEKEAIQSVYNKLHEQTVGKKQTGNKYLEASAQAKKTGRPDPLITISENPRYHPDINAKEKMVDATKAVSNITEDIGNYSNKVRDLYKVADQHLPPVSTIEVAKDTVDKLQNIDIRKYGVAGQKALKSIKEEFETLAQNYGGTISRENLHDVRQAVDDTINNLSDTNLQKQFRETMRSSMKGALEDSIPAELGQDIVRKANNEIGKLYDARSIYGKGDSLKGGLHGTKLISGGKLTDLIRNSVLSSIGAMSAGAVGGMATYALSTKIGEWLAENTLSSAVDRRVLANFIKERPSVFDEIESAIKKLDETGQSQAEKNLKKVIKSPEVKKVLENREPLKELPEGQKSLTDNIIIITDEEIYNKLSNRQKKIIDSASEQEKRQVFDNLKARENFYNNLSKDENNF